VCLANCYAGRFYLLYESEPSLTFGTHLVVGKRSDRGSALRSGTSGRFLRSSAEVDRILQQGRVTDQSGGRRPLVQGATVQKGLGNEGMDAARLEQLGQDGD
jgi:hypothetical protein